MKKNFYLLLLITVMQIAHFSFAQPSLKKIQEIQGTASRATPLVFTFKISPKNQNLGSLFFAPATNISLANAAHWLAGKLQLRAGVDELRKQDIPGGNSEMEIQKFGQYFKGIKVEHGVINVAGNADRLGLLQIEFYPVPDNQVTTPVITEEAALQSAMKYSGAKKYVWEGYSGNNIAFKKPMGELVIVKDYFSTNDTICLAYKFLIIGTEPRVNAYVFVNAITGAIVLVNENLNPFNSAKNTADETADKRTGASIPFAAAEKEPLSNGPLSPLTYTNLVGTAKTLYSGTQNIYTDNSFHTSGTNPPANSNFRLNQSINGFNIETRNGRNTLASLAWIENTTNTWTTPGIDDTALEVHFNLQQVATYWKTRFDRNSYDNANADVIAYVHITDPRYAANAYWQASTNWWPFPSMNYGDGLSSKGIEPYVSLDITAHEFGHAIASSADMPQFVYQREPGALNEGFSDIWAACIEKYSTDANPTSLGTKKIWMMGEEPNHGNATRNLIDPKVKDMADTYYGAFYHDVSVLGCAVADSNSDQCHVHDNSSILTKWFSLITIGGTGVNDHNYSYALTGLGFGKSDSIAYYTERLLTANADYHAVMNTSINYTSWKYGATSNELAQVTGAWRAVGVLDTLLVNNTTLPVFGINNSFTCIAVGKEGHVWAGTSGKGLFKYNDIEWKKYDIPSDSTLTNRVNYRDMKTDRSGGIFIAQSGYTGVSGTSNSSGGVDYFNDTSFKSKKHFGSSPIAYKRNTISRNVTSLWIDTTRNNAIATTRGKTLPQVWITSLAQTTATTGSNSSVGTSGGVARGLTDTIFNASNCCATVPYDSNFMKVSTPYLTNVDNRATLRGAQTIGGNSDEVWVYSDANNEVSLGSWGSGANYYNGSPQQIMRYDAATGDSLGVYTSANVNQLGSYFIVKAIYFDKSGNRWLGLLNSIPPYNNAVVVMDNRGNWHSSSALLVPPDSSLIFPPNTVVNNNAIAGDGDSTVYIGTNNGLVVYTGGATGFFGSSPLEDYRSYRRYTISDGLPSNVIRGMAIDTGRKGIWLATDNGIILWRFRGPSRKINVTAVDAEKSCGRNLDYEVDVKGKFYNVPTPNEFITELSDAHGNFTNPVEIDRQTWVDEAGTRTFFSLKTGTLPLAVPDGDSFKIRVRGTNPAFIGALSKPFKIKKPTIVIPALGAKRLVANRECRDNTGWTNYYYDNGTPQDETDDIRILSIEKAGETIGAIGDGTFEVTGAATAGAGTNTGVNIINSFVSNTYVSMNRYWNVVATTQPSSPVAVRFYYNTQDLVDINGSIPYGPIQHNQLVFYKISGNPDPTQNFVGITAPPISYLNGVVPGLNTWVYTQLTPDVHQAEFLVAGFSGGSGGTTPHGGPLSTLPLQLISFDATIANTGTLLRWKTSSEINTAYFEIERSEDGSNFNQVIGKVTAAGNSSAIKNYLFTDPTPSVGKNYYRLKMVDIDGKTTYSPVKFIHFNKDGAQVVLYPNPSNGVLNIKNNLSGKRIMVTVSDVAGRRLLQVTKANSRLLQLSIAHLSAGSYILQLSDGASVINSKVEKK